MKLIGAALIVVINLMGQTGMAQNQLEVLIKKIKGNEGDIRVALFAETDFLKKPVASKVIKISEPEMKIVFENLPEGEFALSVVHDANSNGELDKNFMGIPKEGYAFSNGVGKFGAPKFKEASFKLPAQAPGVVLDMIYY